MIKSMTGFGKSVCEPAHSVITVEIRTVNSKQLDFSIKTPHVYKEKELEIRSQLAKVIERGKVDFCISTENTGDAADYAFNKALAKKYYEELKSFSEEINEPCQLLPVIMKMPDVLKKDKDEPDEKEWAEIEKCIEQALAQLDVSRQQEGRVLEKDFKERIATILHLLDTVDPYEKQRITAIRERIAKNVTELLSETAVDKNRFEQELLYYIEKLDVTEEKVRLRNHCGYFLDTLKENSSGRKLGFITQEIGREINTLGSKANDADIQQIVVQMKDELEKIKEQLLNIL